MSYESRVYRILIASPSDVDEEREVAARIIQDWNDLHSFNKKIVLLPVRWETHSSPTYGIRPQEAINRQVVDDCDMLIGFFWTKLGTPTGIDISGTVEEITRVANAEKPVMLYFSKRGKDPSLIDIDQLTALNQFKENVYKVAIVENYGSIVDFRDKLSRHLEIKIRELQENEGNDTNLVTFSHINPLNGDLVSISLKKDLERVEIPEEKILDILKNDARVKGQKNEFRQSVQNFLRKKNNIPAVLGLKNNSQRILSNVIADLKIKSSIDDKLNIRTVDTNEDFSFYHVINSYDLPKESVAVIRKLFYKNINKVTPKLWEYSTKPFLLIPGKVGIIDSILFLFPQTSMKIEFDVTIFSDNLLQPIEMNCNMSIKVLSRAAREDEITEIIDQMNEFDDLPF